MSTNSVIHIVLLLISSVAILCLVFLWIPCYIFRCFVFTIAKVFRSDLGCMLSSASIILSDDDFYKNQSNCSVVTVLKFKGSLSLSQVTNTFNDNVIRATISKNSKTRRYPELWQYPVNFMGYPFWKREKNFSLTNHIFETNEKPKTLSEIHQNVMNKNYPKDQSPWQMIIFRTSQVRKETFLVFKIHHCVSDGRSIIKLLVECLGQKALSSKEANYKKIPFQEKMRQLISLPLGLVNLTTELIKLQMHVSNHPWNCQAHCKFPSQLYVSVSNEIPLNLVKNAAKIANVQVSALIMSVVTSAIRKFSRLQHHQFESISIYLTLPKEGHPPTLSNHLYIGIPDIPLVDDDMERVQMLNEIYNCMRHSDHARSLEGLSGMLVTFPGYLRKYLTKCRVVTVGLSNIAGEQEGYKVGENSCEGFTMSAGILQGSIGMGVTVLSYKKSLQVSVVMKGNVFRECDATTMTGLVEQEFLNLEIT